MRKSHLAHKVQKNLQRDKTPSSAQTVSDGKDVGDGARWASREEKKDTSCGTLYVMGQSSEDGETKCQPHFHCLNAAACFVTNPSCASDPQLTLFGLSVTEAVLSAVQADTLYSLASGFAESEPCDRSSQLSVARRHLHHTEYPVQERTTSAGRAGSSARIHTHRVKSARRGLWSTMLSVYACGLAG